VVADCWAGADVVEGCPVGADVAGACSDGAALVGGGVGAVLDVGGSAEVGCAMDAPAVGGSELVDVPLVASGAIGVETVG